MDDMPPVANATELGLERFDSDVEEDDHVVSLSHQTAYSLY